MGRIDGMAVVAVGVRVGVGLQGDQVVEVDTKREVSLFPYHLSAGADDQIIDQDIIQKIDTQAPHVETAIPKST